MGRQTNFVLNTSEEDINNILPENKELMEDFINYLESTDHAKTSLKVYKNNMEIFFVYLLKHAKNKDFVNIKKRDILNFQNYMIKNGLSSARIKNIKSTISSLSNFIESILDEEEKWENFRNIVNKIPAPNPNVVREKTVLEDEDCQRLLDYLVENKQYQTSAKQINKKSENKKVKVKTPTTHGKVCRKFPEAKTITLNIISSFQ